MEVKHGERHVFINPVSSTVNQNSTSKTSHAHHRTVGNGPRVLVNTQMKNPACLQKKQSVNKKDSTSRQGKYNKASQMLGNPTQAGTITLNTGSVYNEPEIYSTLHIATQLAQTRKMQPNVSQLLKNKLDSPNTNAKLKRQVQCINLSQMSLQGGGCGRTTSSAPHSNITFLLVQVLFFYQHFFHKA